MKVSMHQLHYFPWLGYFDKIARSDKFIVMDAVQLTARSFMRRNRFLNRDGDVTMLTVNCRLKGSRERKYREIEAVDVEKWQETHRRFLENNYKTAHCGEVMRHVGHVFTKPYRFLYEAALDSVSAVLNMLGIGTEIVFQTRLEAAGASHSGASDTVLGLCRAAGADIYLAGAGASADYLDRESFHRAGVEVFIQDYSCPVYPQAGQGGFTPDISALDFLLNCGTEAGRRIFWENVGRSADRRF
jgi:hypothetical protein